MDHAWLFMIYDQCLTDRDPEGLVRAIDEVLRQYDTENIANATVALDSWYAMVHR